MKLVMYEFQSMEELGDDFRFVFVVLCVFGCCLPF